MNKGYIVAIACVFGFLFGCASNDYAQMSSASGVPETALTENCSQVTCSYDKLKDRVQASASDISVMFALGGVESRTIQYTWVSGNNFISLDLFLTTLYGGWAFIDSAEVYVGKEMIARVDGKVDRVVGNYNKSAQEHEKIEMLSGAIDLETARKIAEADYQTVTIRFYGKNGYTDKELPREHKLINVVQLASAA